MSRGPHFSFKNGQSFTKPQFTLTQMEVLKKYKQLVRQCTLLDTASAYIGAMTSGGSRRLCHPNSCNNSAFLASCIHMYAHVLSFTLRISCPSNPTTGRVMIHNYAVLHNKCDIMKNVREGRDLKNKNKNQRKQNRNALFGYMTKLLNRPLNKQTNKQSNKQ